MARSDRAKLDGFRARRQNRCDGGVGNAGCGAWVAGREPRCAQNLRADDLEIRDVLIGGYFLYRADSRIDQLGRPRAARCRGWIV